MPSCIPTRLTQLDLHFQTRSSKGLKVGIEMLQSSMNDGRFFLVEDERYGSEPFVKEAGLYSVNNGEPVDAYNHCCDEVRYGHNYFAKTYGLWG